ncbi:MAG TPA: carbohydrate binding family 9 domain-containing protein, partial [Acidobacteriota bacterium]|nr:carbohydrate binding family 9 domain-containing protein [Acidobacteriota bacterium]
MRTGWILIVAFILCATSLLFSETTEIVVPRISERITIDDFAGMKARTELADKLLLIDGFVQMAPSDGSQPTQNTIVYVAYDAENLYVVFLCFDKDSKKISASLTRRESFGEDEDWVEIYVDTYSDQRRSYCFSANALGVQWDSRYSETIAYDDQSGHQPSFDALWYSDGRITDQGYIVWMAIPFKSMRFPSGENQQWRILFGRSIPRTNEYDSWPHRSRDIQGLLTQTSYLNGLKNVAPGKSIQFIPYTSFRSFRVLDSQATP